MKRRDLLKISALAGLAAASSHAAADACTGDGTPNQFIPKKAADARPLEKELEKYNPVLLEKPEYIFISKTDMASPEELNKKIKKVEKISSNILPISIHDWDSLQKVKELLNKIEKEK